MGVRASFQAIPSALYEDIRAKLPSRNAETIQELYPPRQGGETKHDLPIVSGFGGWWVFQTAFSGLGPPLIHAIQGELTFKDGISVQGEEAFDGDHYIGYLSVETVKVIAKQLVSLNAKDT